MKQAAPLILLGSLVAACGLNVSGVDPTGGAPSPSAQGAGGGATGGMGGAGSSSAETSASSGEGGAGGDTGAGGGEVTWTRRRQLTIELGGDGMVGDSPVLVVLNPTRIDYARTQPAGEDLRFTTSDGAEVLPHEIERWDEGNTSFVWVRLPGITQSGMTKTKFWMYYGSSSAEDGQDAAAVWTSFRGVWHLHEGGDALKDSSGNTNAATNHGTTQVNGRIGQGRLFSSTTKSYIDTHHVEDLAQFTIEGWIYAESNAGTTSGPNGLLMREKNYQICWDHPDGLMYAGASLWEQSSDMWVSALYPPLAKDKWYYLAATLGDTTLQVYLNGAPITGIGETPSGAPAPESASAKIGRDATDGDSANFFSGMIDEVRIATGARSPRWIATQYKSMTDNKLVVYGMEQKGVYSMP